jgi:ankyrin repeat protein
VCATQWLRRTVLHLGALSGHAEVVAALLETPGVNPNSEDGDGRSPLFAAASVGSADVVALLLDAGCNTEKDDMHAQTPAFVAAEKGFVQVLKVRPRTQAHPCCCESVIFHTHVPAVTDLALHRCE